MASPSLFSHISGADTGVTDIHKKKDKTPGQHSFSLSSLSVDPLLEKFTSQMASLIQVDFCVGCRLLYTCHHSICSRMLDKLNSTFCSWWREGQVS